MNPPNPILQFFDYDHLTAGPLRAISKPVCDLAHEYNDLLPESAEKTTGLRKLLEAKDCFVRAQLAYIRAAEAKHGP